MILPGFAFVFEPIFELVANGDCHDMSSTSGRILYCQRLVMSQIYFKLGGLES